LLDNVFQQVREILELLSNITIQLLEIVRVIFFVLTGVSVAVEQVLLAGNFQNHLRGVLTLAVAFENDSSV